MKKFLVILFSISLIGADEAPNVKAEAAASELEAKDSPKRLAPPEKLDAKTVVSEVPGVIYKNVQLYIGKPKELVLSFKPAPTGHQIGDAKVASYQVLPDRQELILEPKQAGTTTLTLRDPEGNPRLRLDLNVYTRDFKSLADELTNLLKEVEGIKISILGEKVVVDGNLLVVNDFARVKRVIDAYNEKEKGVIINLTNMDKKAMHIVARKMQEDIRSSGLEDVTIRVVGNERFFMEGYVKSEGEARKAYQIAASYVPQELTTYLEDIGKVKKKPDGFPIIVNLLKLAPREEGKPKRLVKIVVHFVELSNDYARSMGFQWNPAVAADAEVKFGLTKDGRMDTNRSTEGASLGLASPIYALTGLISNLLPKLNFATSHGYARSLESGTIITKEGEKADLKKETSRTIQVGELASGRPDYKEIKIGMTSSFQPVIVGTSDVVDINMAFEMNFPAAADAVTSNTVVTQVLVKSGQSAAIGGVIQNSSSRGFNRNPAGIPEGTVPLFNLFRSKDFQNNKSQFVVFVTPFIVENAHEGVDKIKHKFRIDKEK